ncbi:MAG: DNA polymerase Y family protein, partial [Archangium sp.]|nr:DNA polymerase Y family protein [Archangium sp.]
MRLAYLFFPRFPVQRRVLEQPSLSGRPLILHADERGTQRVQFASGAALKRGIRPGMSVASASALEPSVVRLLYEPGLEHGALMTVGETLLPLAPGFQLDAPEGMWVDASAAHLSGGEASWAQRTLDALRTLCHPTASPQGALRGLRARCVVGSERFTTQALARWSANDSVIIAPERGGPRLAALPLLCLEEGWLGSDQTASYRALGLSTLGELASLPPQALTGRFGSLGLQAARLCRGEDDSRFVADELSEVMEETVQLDWPAEALEPVLFALKTLVDRLAGRLQGRQLAAVRLTVTVGLESGEPLRVPLVLARASAESRLLVELIRHRLTDLTVQQPITTLHVRIDEASADRGRQLILGDAPAGEVALEVVMSRLQSALGEDALFSVEPVATHRPEDGWRAIAPLPQDATLPATSWLAETAEVGPPRQIGAARPSVDSEPQQGAAEPDAGASQAWARVFRTEEGEAGKNKKWLKRKAKTEQHGTISLSTLAHRPPRLFREPAFLPTEFSPDGSLEHVILAG